MSHDEGDALAAACRDNPADAALRGVYADWLEEHGRPALAEYLRGRPERLRGLAVAAAEAYHRHVRPLYRSARGEVVYGRGGQEGRDGAAYAKAWHRRYGPARWLNAGVRIDADAAGLPAGLVLENYRGREVARLPVPAEGGPP